MDIRTYLERIGYDQPVKPDIETLYSLHRTQLLTVPFENLDIHLGEPIQLSEQALWDKIILRKRGGFCYELNGMFAWLLKKIGFEVTYLNGRVYNSEGKRGREFDHLTLLVKIPATERSWLADVGFGDSFFEPLRFEYSGEQAQGSRARVISLATPNGRLSLDSKNLTITTNGKRIKRKLKNETEFQELLRGYFEIVL